MSMPTIIQSIITLIQHILQASKELETRNIPIHHDKM